MRIKYTHLELDKEVVASMAGYYIPQKEVRLKYDGLEVLYVVGRAVIESSCCGTGNWAYAIVPGYIANWQTLRNEDGLPVTEVEPIRDEKARENITRIIENAEHASPIGFW